MQANLVFVAGASPQIITETAYCLLNEPPLETEIEVLTTAPGRDIIRRDLLGRGGAWNRFVRAYPLARRLHLAPGNITVLRDAAGRHLQDVRSREDNAAVADQVAGRLRDLTRDGAPPVHASIAGGRKTMGYLLAAAMMLYGRHDDRLSHVLVHPPELEGTDFYFPPRKPARLLIHRRPDQAAVEVRGQDVRVELADLPFLRLRALRNPAALRRASFSLLVDELQSDLDALAAPRL